MYDPLFSTAAMTEILSDRNFIRQMFRFEVALAEALEQNGLAPGGTSGDISSIDPDSLDITVLADEARSAGNICIPFVKMLTERVGQRSATSAGYVHWGATSQDVIDSAMMMQLREALPLLEKDLEEICKHLAKIIREHKDTVMPGRTWLQQGPPVTLGLKVAGWLDALQRHRERLQETGSRCIVLQFGGAVGTLAALGGDGVAVTHSLAAQLELSDPAMPWHAQRDRVAEFATTLGLLTGTLGKIARDVSLLVQTEVGELMEPAGAGRGGSSTMPHKRNPVSSAVILSAAVRVPALVGTMLSAMVQEHERGVGGWHAEWETLAEIVRLTAGALACALEVSAGAIVDADAMQHNLNILHGVTMAEAVSFALARKVGKAQAHRTLEEISQRAIRQKLTMEQALSQDESLREHFTPQELVHILVPANYLGATATFIEAVLAKQSGGKYAAD